MAHRTRNTGRTDKGSFLIQRWSVTDDGNATFTGYLSDVDGQPREFNSRTTASDMVVDLNEAAGIASAFGPVDAPLVVFNLVRMERITLPPIRVTRTGHVVRG